MKDTKLQIEIALRAGQVAKSALEFTDSTQTALLLKLRERCVQCLTNHIIGGR